MEHGILKVTEQSHKEIEASAVRLHFTIEGENFIYGNAAVEKCAEVKDAVERLKSVGKDISITTQSVSAKSESGWFTKSSKGIYNLVAHLPDLSKINEALGALLDLKNGSLDRMEWVFEDDAAKTELIQSAMVKAKKKAEVMVSAVGYTIAGIRACSDSYEIPPPHTAPGGQSFGSVSRRKMSVTPESAVNIGTELRGRKEITATATIEFFVKNNG